MSAQKVKPIPILHTTYSIKNFDPGFLYNIRHLKSIKSLKITLYCGSKPLPVHAKTFNSKYLRKFEFASGDMETDTYLGYSGTLKPWINVLNRTRVLRFFGATYYQPGCRDVKGYYQCLKNQKQYESLLLYPGEIIHEKGIVYWLAKQLKFHRKIDELSNYLTYEDDGTLEYWGNFIEIVRSTNIRPRKFFLSMVLYTDEVMVQSFNKLIEEWKLLENVEDLTIMLPNFGSAQEARVIAKHLMDKIHTLPKLKKLKHNGFAQFFDSENEPTLPLIENMVSLDLQIQYYYFDLKEFSTFDAIKDMKKLKSLAVQFYADYQQKKLKVVPELGKLAAEIFCANKTLTSLKIRNDHTISSFYSNFMVPLFEKELKNLENLEEFELEIQIRDPENVNETTKINLNTEVLSELQKLEQLRICFNQPYNTPGDYDPGTYDFNNLHKLKKLKQLSLKVFEKSVKSQMGLWARLNELEQLEKLELGGRIAHLDKEVLEALVKYAKQVRVLGNLTIYCSTIEDGRKLVELVRSCYANRGIRNFYYNQRGDAGLDIEHCKELHEIKDCYPNRKGFTVLYLEPIQMN